jgi:hypothetical protein
VTYIHKWVLFSHKEEWTHVICREMDGMKNHGKWDKSQRQWSHVFFHMWNLEKRMEVQKGHNRERTISSINGWENWISICTRIKLDIKPPTTYKNTQNGLNLFFFLDSTGVWIQGLILAR